MSANAPELSRSQRRATAPRAAEGASRSLLNPAARRSPVAAFLTLFGLRSDGAARPGGVPTVPAALLLLQWAWFRRGENPLFNQSPVVRPGQTGGPGTGLITGSVEATDPDGDTLTYALGEEPTRGSVVVNADGSYVYTPGADLARTGGTDSFTVVVRDNDPSKPGLGAFTDRARAALALRNPRLAAALFGAHSVTTRITLTVTAAATPAPDVVVDPRTGVVSGQVGPDDGIPRTYSVTTAPTRGRVTVDSFGRYVYTPSRAAQQAAAGTPGPDCDTFTVSVEGPDGVVVQRRAVAPLALLAAPGSGEQYDVVVPVAAPAPANPPTTTNEVTIESTYTRISPDGRYAVAEDSRTGNVDLIDAATGAVRRIATGIEAGAIEFSPDSRRAYVLDRTAGNVTVLDTATGAVVTTIPVGSLEEGGYADLSPDGSQYRVVNYERDQITTVNTADDSVVVIDTELSGRYGYYSPDGSRSYFLDRRFGGVTVVDTASDSVVAAIPTPPGAEVTFTPDGGRAVIRHGDFAGSLTVIDTATNVVVGTPAVGSYPSPVAFSPDSTRAFVQGAEGTITVIDLTSGAVINTIAFPLSPDDGFAGIGPAVFTPDGRRAYITDRVADRVVVVDPADGTVVAELPVADNPWTSSLSPGGSRLYVVSGLDEDQTLTAIDAATNTVLGVVATGNFVDGAVFTPDGARAYLSDNRTGTVLAIDVATGAVSVVPVGEGAGQIVISPDGRRAYVYRPAEGVVTVLDTADDSVVTTFPVSGAVRVRFTPDERYGIAGDWYYGTVTTLISTADDSVTTFPASRGTVVSEDGRYVWLTDEGTVTVVDLGQAGSAAATGSNGAAAA